MAGMEGFEPPNTGTRNQRLTTWPHPNMFSVTQLVKEGFDRNGFRCTIIFLS